MYCLKLSHQWSRLIGVKSVCARMRLESRLCLRMRISACDLRSDRRKQSTIVIKTKEPREINEHFIRWIVMINQTEKCIPNSKGLLPIELIDVSTDFLGIKIHFVTFDYFLFVILYLEARKPLLISIACNTIRCFLYTFCLV